MTLMKKLLATAGVFGAAITIAGSAHAAKISISCGAVGQELALCQEGVDAWAAKTGNEVSVISTPNSTTERLALYQQILAAGSADIDHGVGDIIGPYGAGLVAKSVHQAGIIEPALARLSIRG